MAVESEVIGFQMKTASGSEMVGAERESDANARKGHMPGEAGIWIMIFGDMVMFLLLFGGFMTDRLQERELFNQSSDSLHVTIGAINTLLLLSASLGVALAVRALREKVFKYAPGLIAAALACAIAFVGNKYVEWGDLIKSGVVPVTNRFYLWYFILTGIHLAHVLAGTCVLLYLYKVAKRARHEAISFRGVENGACYWHMVDLLWVILFPLLYLMR